MFFPVIKTPRLKNSSSNTLTDTQTLPAKWGNTNTQIHKVVICVVTNGINPMGSLQSLSFSREEHCIWPFPCSVQWLPLHITYSQNSSTSNQGKKLTFFVQSFLLGQSSSSRFVQWSSHSIPWMWAKIGKIPCVSSHPQSIPQEWNYCWFEVVII